jgi:hypothetical protein
VQRKGGPDLKKDCDPPWFIDAQGVKHYKMQCLDP